MYLEVQYFETMSNNSSIDMQQIAKKTQFLKKTIEFSLFLHSYTACHFDPFDTFCKMLCVFHTTYSSDSCHQQEIKFNGSYKKISKELKMYFYLIFFCMDIGQFGHLSTTYIFLRNVMKNENNNFLVYLIITKNKIKQYTVFQMTLAQESTPKIPTNGFANFCLHLTDFSHWDKNLF